MNKHFYSKLALTTFACLPAIALAHSEASGNGFIAGLTHPIFGFDHLLAMLSVGIISAQYGGRWIWLVPAIFVSFMVIGGILGANGIGLPYVELGIATSVIVLGVGISLANYKKHQQWLVPLSILFVLVFGALHGHAHGEEMPGSASPIYYTFGFIVSTCLIHLLGVLIGHMISNRDTLKKTSTFLGVVFAGLGCYILLGL